MSSNLMTHPPTNLYDLVDCYNATLATLLNKHAPLKSKILHTKPANHWFTPALNKLKLTKRHLERVWSKSHSIEDLKLLRTASNHYHAAIIKAKRVYNSTLIASSLTNPRQLWNNVNKMLHRTSSPVLPSYDSEGSLSQSFATFFSGKIHKLHTGLLSNRSHTSPHIPPPFTPPNFSSFTSVTIDEVSKLFSQSPDTNCDLDPIPISLLKQCSSVLLPTITKIIHLYLHLYLLVSFLINLRAVLFILTLKSLTSTNKISQIIVPFLTYLSCLNSLKELLNFVSLITCLITVCSILSSLLTSNVILLRLLFYLFMTTSLRL